MSDPGDLSESSRQHGQNLPAWPAPQGNFSVPPSPQPGAPRAKSSLSFDPRRIVLALKRSKGRLLLAAGITAALAMILGYLWSDYYIKVTFILQNPGEATVNGPDGESTRTRLLTPSTLVKLMQSTELLRRVAAEAQPPVSDAVLPSRVTVKQEKEPDLVSATIAGGNARDLANLAAVFAQEATQMGRDLQTAETRQMNRYYKDRIASTESEMAEADAKLVQFQKEQRVLDPQAESQAYMKQYADLLAQADDQRMESGTLDMQITALQVELARQNPAAQKLAAAKSKLNDLLAVYTEQHPSVQAQRREIEALQQQAAAAQAGPISADEFSDNSIGSALYQRLVELQTRKAALEKHSADLAQLETDLQDKVTGLSEKGVQDTLIETRLESLQNTHALLVERQRDAQLYEENAQGYFRAFAPPSLKDINPHERVVNALWMALAGFGLGLAGAGIVIATKEIADDRLKTAADVERVTGLPVLAALGDLNTMSETEREQWAFRAWTALSGQLSTSANHGMVCGFISSSHGEGRSTWINLLANAATQRGLRVLAVAAETNGTGNAANQGAMRPAAPSPGGGSPAGGAQLELQLPAAMASLEDVNRALTRPDGPPVAHLPLSGWVWNLERRKQWQNALAEWKRMDDLVLLIELPPASRPEAVLLAENLPQVIWLADGGKSRTRETRQQLETLRHAKCRLACAVLNHQPEPVL